MSDSTVPTSRAERGQGRDAAGAASPEAARGLADLILLMKRARAAPDAERIGFLLVNDTTILTDCEAAVLWRARARGGRVAAVMGLPQPEPFAPFTAWAGDLAAALHARADDGAPLTATAADVPKGIADTWGEHFPAHALWLPLRDRNDQPMGGLLLGRGAPWQRGEVSILSHWTATCAHELAAAEGLRRQPGRGRRAWRWMLLAPAAAILAGLLTLPVQLSVLAPAEVVPRNPQVVRAPYGGVIDSVTVTPNSRVAAGDSLLRLDSAELETRRDVADRALQIARARLRQAEQGAVGDREAKTTLPVLRMRVDRHEAEVEYVQSLLDRIEVAAERPGIVLMPPRSELIGKPVRQGERIMSIADPAEAELEIWIPARDAVDFPDEASVALFPNVSPEQRIPARLSRIDYTARRNAEGIVGFRAVARFAETATPPRIGQRGTAKIHAREVRLYYMLFRRPVSILRQWLGI